MARSYRSPSMLAASTFFLFILVSFFDKAIAQVVTSAPRAYRAVDISDLFFERRGVQHCDGNNGFWSCKTGTCYTGTNGYYIGCCTLSSCPDRTTCIPYTRTLTPDCDPNVDGCLVCSNALPYCVTEYNYYNGQYIMYCNSYSTFISLSYTNTVTPSTASADITTVTSTNIQTITLGPPVRITPTSTTLQTSLSTTGTFVATETPTATDGPVGGKPPLPNAAITGISVGCGILVIGLLAFLFCYRRRRHRRDSRTPFTIVNPSQGSTPPVSKLQSNQIDPLHPAPNYSETASAAANQELSSLSEVSPATTPMFGSQFAPYPNNNLLYPSLSRQPGSPPGSPDSRMAETPIPVPSPSPGSSQQRYMAYNPLLHSSIITNPDPPSPASSSRPGTPRPAYNPHHLSVVSELDVYPDDPCSKRRGPSAWLTPPSPGSSRLSAQGASGYQSAEEALARGLRHGNYAS